MPPSAHDEPASRLHSSASQPISIPRSNSDRFDPAVAFGTIKPPPSAPLHPVVPSRDVWPFDPETAPTGRTPSPEEGAEPARFVPKTSPDTSPEVSPVEPGSPGAQSPLDHAASESPRDLNEVYAKEMGEEIKRIAAEEAEARARAPGGLLASPSSAQPAVSVAVSNPSPGLILPGADNTSPFVDTVVQTPATDPRLFARLAAFKDDLPAAPTFSGGSRTGSTGQPGRGPGSDGVSASQRNMPPLGFAIEQGREAGQHVQATARLDGTINPVSMQDLLGLGLDLSHDIPSSTPAIGEATGPAHQRDERGRTPARTDGGLRAARPDRSALRSDPQRTRSASASRNPPSPPAIRSPFAAPPPTLATLLSVADNASEYDGVVLQHATDPAPSVADEFMRRNADDALLSLMQRDPTPGRGGSEGGPEAPLDLQPARLFTGRALPGVVRSSPPAWGPPIVLIAAEDRGAPAGAEGDPGHATRGLAGAGLQGSESIPFSPAPAEPSRLNSSRQLWTALDRRPADAGIALYPVDRYYRLWIGPDEQNDIHVRRGLSTRRRSVPFGHEGIWVEASVGGEPSLNDWAYEPSEPADGEPHDSRTRHLFRIRQAHQPTLSESGRPWERKAAVARLFEYEEPDERVERWRRQIFAQAVTLPDRLPKIITTTGSKSPFTASPPVTVLDSPGSPAYYDTLRARYSTTEEGKGREVDQGLRPPALLDPDGASAVDDAAHPSARDKGKGKAPGQGPNSGLLQPSSERLGGPSTEGILRQAAPTEASLDVVAENEATRRSERRAWRKAAKEARRTAREARVAAQSLILSPGVVDLGRQQQHLGPAPAIRTAIRGRGNFNIWSDDAAEAGSEPLRRTADIFGQINTPSHSSRSVATENQCPSQRVPEQPRPTPSRMSLHYLLNPPPSGPAAAAATAPRRRTTSETGLLDYRRDPFGERARANFGSSHSRTSSGLVRSPGSWNLSALLGPMREPLGPLELPRAAAAAERMDLGAAPDVRYRTYRNRQPVSDLGEAFFHATHDGAPWERREPVPPGPRQGHPFWASGTYVPLTGPLPPALSTPHMVAAGPLPALAAAPAPDGIARRHGFRSPPLPPATAAPRVAAAPTPGPSRSQVQLPADGMTFEEAVRHAAGRARAFTLSFQGSFDRSPAPGGGGSIAAVAGLARYPMAPTEPWVASQPTATTATAAIAGGVPSRAAMPLPAYAPPAQPDLASSSFEPVGFLPAPSRTNVSIPSIAQPAPSTSARSALPFPIEPSTPPRQIVPDSTSATEQGSQPTAPRSSMWESRPDGSLIIEPIHDIPLQAIRQLHPDLRHCLASEPMQEQVQAVDWMLQIILMRPDFQNRMCYLEHEDRSLPPGYAAAQPRHESPLPDLDPLLPASPTRPWIVWAPQSRARAAGPTQSEVPPPLQPPPPAAEASQARLLHASFSSLSAEHAAHVLVADSGQGQPAGDDHGSDARPPPPDTPQAESAARAGEMARLAEVGTNLVLDRPS